MLEPILDETLSNWDSFLYWIIIAISSVGLTYLVINNFDLIINWLFGGSDGLPPTNPTNQLINAMDNFIANQDDIQVYRKNDDPDVTPTASTSNLPDVNEKTSILGLNSKEENRIRKNLFIYK